MRVIIKQTGLGQPLFKIHEAFAADGRKAHRVDYEGFAVFSLVQDGVIRQSEIIRNGTGL